MKKSECPNCFRESIVFKETKELKIVRCSLCKFKIEMPILPTQEITFEKANPEQVKQNLKNVMKSIKESDCLTEKGEVYFTERGLL